MFDSSFYFKFGSILTRGERGERMTGGLIGSSLLHALAALVLILGMPRFVPEHEMIMSINLVQLGERNAAPPSPDMARLPQEKAREAIKSGIHQGRSGSANAASSSYAAPAR